MIKAQPPNTGPNTGPMAGKMAGRMTGQTSGETGAEFSDTVWMDVLSAMDRTYNDLVDYQERLERQNAELEQMRSFLGSILGSVSDVLIAVNRDGLIEETSASLLAHMRLGAGQLQGKPVAAVFAPACHAALNDAITRSRTQRDTVMLEADLATTPGSDTATPVTLDLSIAPRLDDRGRSAGLVLTGRSVGELRQAYAELERSHDELKSAQGQLVRNEKLASLGRLLAGVAHELNNPISFVYANTHSLEKYVGKFQTYFEQVQAGASRADLVQLREDLRLDRAVTNLADAVHGARDGAERVRDIVEDLRRLSSDGSGETSDFDLVETSQVAANWVFRGARRAVDLQFDGLDRLTAHGRPGHVQQVVMNLVQNALDALEGIENARITLSHRIIGDHAVVQVRDNGAGISETDAAAIFDPFFTTKPVGRGTGLGLSISHKIAQEHGGGLRLCNAGETGACFRLSLPLGQSEQTPPSNPQEEPPK